MRGASQGGAPAAAAAHRQLGQQHGRRLDTQLSPERPTKRPHLLHHPSAVLALHCSATHGSPSKLLGPSCCCRAQSDVEQCSSSPALAAHLHARPQPPSSCESASTRLTSRSSAPSSPSSIHSPHSGALPPPPPPPPPRPPSEWGASAAPALPSSAHPAARRPPLHWAAQVSLWADTLGISSPSTVHLALHCYPRLCQALSTPLLAVRPGAQHTLTALCVWLSAKLEEQRCVVPRAAALSGALGVTQHALCRMEVLVLHLLEWRPYQGFIRQEDDILTFL